MHPYLQTPSVKKRENERFLSTPRAAREAFGLFLLSCFIPTFWRQKGRLPWAPDWSLPHAWGVPGGRAVGSGPLPVPPRPGPGLPRGLAPITPTPSAPGRAEDTASWRQTWARSLDSREVGAALPRARPTDRLGCGRRSPRLPAQAAPPAPVPGPWALRGRLRREGKGFFRPAWREEAV